jgi:hypothetical protein
LFFNVPGTFGGLLPEPLLSRKAKPTTTGVGPERINGSQICQR